MTTSLAVRLRPYAFIAFLLLVWYIAIATHPDHLLPDPIVVGRAFVELALRGLLLKYIVASLFRVTWGFLLAALIAIPLGLAIGWYRRSEMAVNPLLQIFRPISPLAWIPISILWFGVGDLAAIFVIYLELYFQFALLVKNAGGIR